MSEAAGNLWERIRVLAAKWRENPRFPRKMRILCNGAMIVALLLLAYGLLGCPTLSMEARYRRVERAHMVGPARILGIEEGEYPEYDHLLMAEDEEGVILYTYDSTVWGGQDHLIYRKKTAPLTVLTGPSRFGAYTSDSDFSVPVVIFDSCPQAKRVKVEIHMPGRERPYEIDAQRRAQGYFLGEIHFIGRESGRGDDADAEAAWLQQLAKICDSSSMTADETVIEVRARFYDAGDRLLCEETAKLRSVAAEAHLEREGEE